MITNRFAHERYEGAPDKVRSAIDEAARTVIQTFRAHGFNTNNLDPAENMVAALMIYLEESNPELRGTVCIRCGQQITAEDIRRRDSLNRNNPPDKARAFVDRYCADCAAKLPLLTIITEAK